MIGMMNHRGQADGVRVVGVNGGSYRPDPAEPRLRPFAHRRCYTYANRVSERAPQFECDGCGACCRTFPIFASAADADREPRIAGEGRALPEHLTTDRWTFQLFPLPFHEACCFLNGDSRCVIYATRPDVCQAFPAGGEQCQAARARIGQPPLRPAGSE